MWLWRPLVPKWPPFRDFGIIGTKGQLEYPITSTDFQARGLGTRLGEKRSPRTQGQRAGGQLGPIRSGHFSGPSQDHRPRNVGLLGWAGWLSANTGLRRVDRFLLHGVPKCRSGTEPLQKGEICACSFGANQLLGPSDQQIGRCEARESWRPAELQASDTCGNPANVCFRGCRHLKASGLSLRKRFRPLPPRRFSTPISRLFTSCALSLRRFFWRSRKRGIRLLPLPLCPFRSHFCLCPRMLPIRGYVLPPLNPRLPFLQ